jgi:hypothetical protein
MNDILPLCCGCGSLRRPDGRWDRSADFRRIVPSNRASHGICPDCLERLYPDMALILKRRRDAAASAAPAAPVPAGSPLF